MKKYASYLITAAACLAVGLFFRFALMGYRVLGYGFMLIALAALYFMALKILEPKAPRAAKFLDKLGSYGIILFSFALVITVAMIAVDAKGEDNGGADYAIVLGAGVNGEEPSASLAARLRAAKEYAEANPDCVIIVSGGKGSGENISEAECMRRWLVRNGVDEARIIMEDRSERTEENLAFSREIILSREPDFDGRVCVITEIYHVTRAKLFARKAGFESVVSAWGWTGLPVLTANYYIREALGVWHFLVFSR
ncbi:MAG: YdcF family protein [Oscillospiraceae bacterium]|nr:YdcF family protein [Oscillospiraceae bacterium]